jgi:hypothetical protein
MDRKVVGTTAAFRKFFKRCVEYLATESTSPDTPFLQTIAWIMSVGGWVDVVAGQGTPAKDEQDFKRGVSCFLEPKEANENGILTPLDKRTFDFSEYAGTMCFNKRLFRTSKGYIGLGPATTRPGDIVTVLSGCRVPFVLLPEQNEGESPSESRFILNGECYIDGIMFGEAMQEYQQAGLPLTTFNLV